MAAAEVNPDMTGFDIKVMRNPGKKEQSLYNLHQNPHYFKIFSGKYVQ